MKRGQAMPPMMKYFLIFAVALIGIILLFAALYVIADTVGIA